MSVLWDMATFFDAMKRAPLWERALQMRMPRQAVVCAARLYAMPRALCLQRYALPSGPALDGVPAGDILAMPFVKAYTT